MRKQLHKIDIEHKIDTTSTEPVQTEEELEKQLKAAKIKTELIIKVDEALQKKNDAAIENFERNQHMRLKFLCKDAPEDIELASERQGKTVDELYI